MLFHVIPAIPPTSKFQEHPLATGITSHPRVPGAAEELVGAARTLVAPRTFLSEQALGAVNNRKQIMTYRRLGSMLSTNLKLEAELKLAEINGVNGENTN